MKCIAALCMLIDHIGMMFYPFDLRWRIIGRLAMPIFAYGVARGAFYTTSLKKYMKKMLLFSFASQIPFWGMQYLGGGEAFFELKLNIGFTFFIALGCISLLKVRENLSSTPLRIVALIGIIMSIILADVLGCDYGSYGVLVVLLSYGLYHRKASIGIMAVGYVLLTILFFAPSMYGCLLQGVGIVAYGVIYGTRYLSERRFGRFFYWFYPLHMIVLVGLRWLQMYK